MDELDNVYGDDLLKDEDFTQENPVIIKSDEDDIFSTTRTEDFETEPTVLDEFLKGKGIVGGKVKVLNEKNEEEELDFYNLTKQEQLDILNSFVEEQSAPDELQEQLASFLKEKNLTVEQFLAQYKDSIVQELRSQYEPNYEIDAYSDEELFLLDLKTRFELSDEELQAELEKELKNPDLFKKKIDATRAEYKKLEDEYNTEKQNEFNQEREKEYNEFADSLVEVALKTPEFYGIELEDSEKEQVLSFVLDLDNEGRSEFYKTISSPDKIYEVAWFLKYGKEAFDAIKNAYEQEIAKLKKDKGQVIIKDGPKKVENIHQII